VASDATNSEVQAEESHAPRECMPCRGTGQLISNLGGTPSEVTCPWCAGGGVRIPGTDAQSAWPTESAVADGGDGAASAAASESSS
jgi:DnaJ-class molecular chaperone